MQPRLQLLDIPLLQAFISQSQDGCLKVHPHWHKEIELVLVQEGSARQQAGNCFFDTGKGDIFIVGTNQPHSTYSYEGTHYRCMVFVLDIEKFFPARFSLEESLIISEFSSGLRFFPAAGTSSDLMGKLADCLVTIWNELEGKHYTYECVIRQKIFEFISLVLKNGKQMLTGQNDTSNHNDAVSSLRGTFKLIEEKYTEDISLSMAAKASNLSVTHFCRLFRSAAGITFNEYLNRYRINRAELMLLSCRPEIEVALECGFGSFDSFLRNFKKYKNCTPTEYKRQNGIW